jgi:hypothetical protein
MFVCDICSLILIEPHTNQIQGFGQENEPLKIHLPYPCSIAKTFRVRSTLMLILKDDD